VPRLNYHHLHYFWAVAHEGNLTRAAEKLHVSQSSVSVQIQKLEQSLGHQLFDRRNRGLILTEAGQIALDHADAIFSIGDELLGTLHETGRERTVLRVGSMSTLSRNFQLRFLAPVFRRDDVETVVRSGTLDTLLRLLEGHHLDVVLANTVPPRDARTNWVAHRIAEQPLSLIGGPEAARPGRSVESLLEEHPLVLPAQESGIRIGFDAFVDRLGVRPRIAAEVDDMAMLRLVARERIGLAVIPAIVVRDELVSGELVEVAELPELRETFYAITPSRRFPNPLLKELVQEGRLDDGGLDPEASAGDAGSGARPVEEPAGVETG
jgi:LysR family transcriptional activator of nhaA